MIRRRGRGPPRPCSSSHSVRPPPALWAADSGSPLPDLLLVIAAMLAVGKLLGAGAERLGLPSVLGELTAGVLLGPTLLGIVPTGVQPGAEMIAVLAELGVIMLLFEVGLETDLAKMFKVGTAALAVAVVGVTLPFALGYFYWA